MINDLRVFGFYTGKSKTDDLFDELDTSKLNAHLKELMPALTAKVFRTYNASITLDDMVCCQPLCTLEKVVYVWPILVVLIIYIL